MKDITVAELLSELEDCDPDAIVRLAIQPSWPFEHQIGVIQTVMGNHGDVVYIGDGGQLDYLSGDAKDALGW
jgi:hypothetical protein